MRWCEFYAARDSSGAGGKKGWQEGHGKSPRFSVSGARKVW